MKKKRMFDKCSKCNHKTKEVKGIGYCEIQCTWCSWFIVRLTEIFR